MLRQKLVKSSLLAYPDFDKDFTLETDASKLGLGAILSQYHDQDDNKLHPVAYASRSVSVSEAKYSISDLETLAVVWAVTHFRYYLYGHNVNIFTDRRIQMLQPVRFISQMIRLYRSIKAEFKYVLLHFQEISIDMEASKQD